MGRETLAELRTMRHFRLSRHLFRFGGRLTVALAVVAFIALNVGFPLPQPPSPPQAKDTSTPFPCQNRPCGCQSAEACFRGCCCFTATERVAWALAHQVEPPAALIAQAAKEQLCGNEHTDNHGPVKANCCAKSHTAAPAKCEHEHNEAAADDDCHHDVDEHVAAQPSTKFVIGMMAAKCRGLSPLLTLAFSALPSITTVGYSYDWSPRDWVVVDTPRASSRSIAPPMRPPCA